MARAVMEGVVFDLKESIEIFNSLGIEFNRVIASGGGAQSAEWLKIQADILGKEVYCTNVIEQAGMGAAIMASVGARAFPSVKDACGQMVSRAVKQVDPDPKNMRIYDEYFEIFKRLYTNNCALYEQFAS